MKFLATIAVIFAVWVPSAFAANSPHASYTVSGDDVIFVVNGLVPGDEFRWSALASTTGDPYPACTGASDQQVRSDGTITFFVSISDTTFWKRNADKLTVILQPAYLDEAETTYPPCGSNVVTDENGLPIQVEVPLKGNSSQTQEVSLVKQAKIQEITTRVRDSLSKNKALDRLAALR